MRPCVRGCNSRASLPAPFTESHDREGVHQSELRSLGQADEACPTWDKLQKLQLAQPGDTPAFNRDSYKYLLRPGYH